MDNELIEKIKVALIYGKNNVDGKDQDGCTKIIYKDAEDTAHLYYMLDFLETNLKNHPELEKAIDNHNVNSIFYEIQALGHIVFAENTTSSHHKTGLFYMPKDLSEKQIDSLRKLQSNLEKENYEITILHGLYRESDGVLMGNQSIGSAKALNSFIPKNNDLEVDEHE